MQGRGKSKAIPEHGRSGSDNSKPSFSCFQDNRHKNVDNCSALNLKGLYRLELYLLSISVKC